MRSIGIFGSPARTNVPDLAAQLVALAEAHDVEVFLQTPCAEAIGRPELGRHDSQVAAGSVLVTLSGDGGVLAAARAATVHETPVLAVDLGRLGFLSAVRPTELDAAFGMLLRNEFCVEERIMLDARVLRGNGSAAHEVGGNIGLNDAVVAKSALARILRLSIRIDGDLVAETRADGLVISTPTGSTAYALAAGGPIVHPGVPLMLICPICAHSLTQRPLVVGHRETVEVQAEWEGDEVPTSQLDTMLTIDGQVGFSLRSGDIVRVRCADRVARLLRKPDENFYDRLREKMRWGR